MVHKYSSLSSFLILLTISFHQAYGQNGVAIAASTATADNSAMLDVQSTTKGALIPRMTNSQRSSIPSPANGLLVFCTDAPVGLYYYNTSIPAWVILSAGALTGAGTANYDAMWTGTGTLGSGIIYNSGSSIGVGTNAPYTTLDVVGSIYTSVHGSTNEHATAEQGTSYIGHKSGNTSDGFAGMAITVNPGNNAIANAGIIQFYTWGNSVSASREVARINELGNIGIGTTTPGYKLDVAGDVNTNTGFTISGAAASGSYLRGNGTNFVSSAIQAGDIPGGSGNYIQNTTSQQATSNFNISGAGVIAGNLTISGTTTLANNSGGATHPLYLAGTDLNHYIYSTGTGGNSMFFGEYSGVYNFYNTATATTQVSFNAGSITATGVSGTGTRPVWANASGTLNNSGRVNVIGGSTITGIAVGTAETNYVTTGTLAVVSGELVRIDGTVTCTFPGGSGTDHFTVTIRSNGTSGCSNTTFCVETMAPMGNANRGTYYTYPFVYYWNVNCTGNVTFTIDVATLDSDDSWNINGAALTATKQ